MNIINQFISKDGITQKFLQKTYTGEIIETVLVERPEKRIICFSTQIGCSMSCSICAVSQQGFIRNLETKELVDQCLNITHDKISRPTLFSAMGIGEPTLNNNLVSAFKILSNYGKLALSTIGISPRRILKISQELENFPLKIQLSIHGSNDDLRRELLDKRLPSLNETLDIFSQIKQPIEYNYTLLLNKNDTIQNAEELSLLLKDRKGKVKLNRYNPIELNNFMGSTKDRIDQFIYILTKNGIESEIYETDGLDINAACGQLAIINMPLKNKSPTFDK